jgi:hypothetical protein
MDTVEGNQTGASDLKSDPYGNLSEANSSEDELDPSIIYLTQKQASTLEAQKNFFKSKAIREAKKVKFVLLACGYYYKDGTSMIACMEQIAKSVEPGLLNDISEKSLGGQVKRSVLKRMLKSGGHLGMVMLLKVSFELFANLG